jgi:hypothetical protein
VLLINKRKGYENYISRGICVTALSIGLMLVTACDIAPVGVKYQKQTEKKDAQAQCRDPLCAETPCPELPDEKCDK